MVINVKKEDIFIPEWNGNQDLPDAEQIKFYHRFLTTDERERYCYIKNFTEGKMQRLFDIVQKPEFDIEAYVENNDREVIRDKRGIAKAIVTKIENLVLENETGGKETVNTIEGFYNAPDAYSGLRAELEGYVLNLSAKVDSKNS